MESVPAAGWTQGSFKGQLPAPVRRNFDIILTHHLDHFSPLVSASAAITVPYIVIHSYVALLDVVG